MGLKKERVIILSIILFSLIAIGLFLIVNLHTASAISINSNNPADPLGIGLNAGDIPQNPEDLANASANYLQTRWTQFFTESPVLGPIHRAFLANPIPFKILFNEPYGFTFTFFCILILWIFLLASVGNVAGAYSGSGMAGVIIGLLAAIALAHSGFIGVIVRFFINLIVVQQSVWVRILIWLAIIIVLIFIYIFDSMWKKSVKTSKKQKKERMQKQKVEEHEEFVRGVEEGRKLTEPLRKLKKKISGSNYQIDSNL